MESQSDAKKSLNLRSIAGKMVKPLKILLVNNKSKNAIVFFKIYLYGIIMLFHLPILASGFPLFSLRILVGKIILGE